MKKIALFAGTTEGRMLAEQLEKFPMDVYIFTATEYGKESLGTYKNAKILSGRMDAEEMRKCFEEKQIDLVVDATHPYARIVTENIRQACKNMKILCLRCVREVEKETDKEMKKNENLVVVEELDEAIGYLKGTEGNILITTGSKELQKFMEIEDYQNRCFVRVLSVKESIEKAIDFGFSGAHLIAMQGPFSKEMNTALCRHINAKYMVTKESGKAGGFEEKLKAAGECGVQLVVIRRPEEKGYSVEEIMEKIRFGRKRWNKD